MRGDLFPDHPLQQAGLENLAFLAELRTEEIPFGRDGRGLPTYQLPLERLAYAFARLANPWDLGGELALAIRRLTDAITEHPDMIEGTGNFDTRLIQ